jgi:hypothetical protein
MILLIYLLIVLLIKLFIYNILIDLRFLESTYDFFTFYIVLEECYNYSKKNYLRNLTNLDLLRLMKINTYLLSKA